MVESDSELKGNAQSKLLDLGTKFGECLRSGAPNVGFVQWHVRGRPLKVQAYLRYPKTKDIKHVRKMIV